MSKCALCKTSLKDDEINVCDKCRLDFLNFKQQLSEKDKEIERLNDRLDKYISGRLKSMLAEKDGEIERLKQENDKLALALAEEPDKDELLELKQDFDILYNKTKERDVSIRKQVCDEIREKLGMNQYNTCENTAFGVYYDYLKEILDQIEQGEQQ